ncbi:MAG: hypothetical protein GF421_08740 [Candidatus Aminicenantes bacterium]|nr:hypothetical protein [Candidatus Aminicenantes bacterium]
MNRKILPVFLFLLFISSWGFTSTDSLKFDQYHNPAELIKAVQALAADYPEITRLHKIASTPSQRELYILEIGSETNKAEKELPAVLVAANMEGTVPIASEAALYLAKKVLEDEKLAKTKTWYILPCGNPDAAARYFLNPLTQDARNSKPVNDDMDDQVDEDGMEDLDGNGIYTMMRVKSPEGTWMPVPGEPRLMKQADPSKGEQGVYRLYSEGLDNDRDGEYNEDGPGGVNIGINFPHLFHFHTKTGGAWPGSEEESYNLIKFIMEHREIGLTFCFGSTNFCLKPPQGGRKGSVNMDQLKIPERYGEMLGIDTEKTYTMKEIIELLQPYVPEGMEITESLVAQFLGLGAVVNPLPEDLKYYNELSEKYKEFLKQNNLDTERLDPQRAKDGSFELWAYYHLGLPSFSLDFWTLPKVKEEKKEQEVTPEKLGQMTNEEFIALGEEKIDEFLKSIGAPEQFKAKNVIEAVKSGAMDTLRMAEMLKKMPQPKDTEAGTPEEKAFLAFSDKKLDGKGFVKWESYDHPTLGKVEIGGQVPFVKNTPPADMLEPLLEGQVPWVFEVADKMAHINISHTEVKNLGEGLFLIKAWIQNSGYLPYPTAMGQRNNRILPVAVTLEGEIEILEGKKRSLIKSFEKNNSQEVSWLIHAQKSSEIKIHANTRMAWKDSKTIFLGGNR